MKAQDPGTTVDSKNTEGKHKESSIAVRRSPYLEFSNELLHSVAVVFYTVIKLSSIKASSQFTKDEKRYWRF